MESLCKREDPSGELSDSDPHLRQLTVLIGILCQHPVCDMHVFKVDSNANDIVAEAKPLSSTNSGEICLTVGIGLMRFEATQLSCV